MTKDFFKNKLNQHLYNILSPRGETFEINDNIFSELTEGCYEIVWHFRKLKVIGLNKLNDSYEIKNGKYVIGNRSLYPSQFIHFKISDWREEKINELLEIKK
jgi:hypothetical protein